ncbi:hypothetical protein G3N57_16785 [Paraburkholderia sp. Se-20369]|nr:hypothetical protein [Paraburkholderia sp. Se-20369]
MREISHAERTAVSGGGFADWIGNLFRPSRPSEPWVNPFPSDNSQTGAVETLGKVVVALGVTAIAVTLAVLGRAARQ